MHDITCCNRTSSNTTLNVCFETCKPWIQQSFILSHNSAIQNLNRQTDSSSDTINPIFITWDFCHLILVADARFAEGWGCSNRQTDQLSNRSRQTPSTRFCGLWLTAQIVTETIRGSYRQLWFLSVFTFVIMRLCGSASCRRHAV